MQRRLPWTSTSSIGITSQPRTRLRTQEQYVTVFQSALLTRYSMGSSKQQTLELEPLNCQHDILLCFLLHLVPHGGIRLSDQTVCPCSPRSPPAHTFNYKLVSLRQNLTSRIFSPPLPEIATTTLPRTSTSMDGASHSISADFHTANHSTKP